MMLSAAPSYGTSAPYRAGRLPPDFAGPLNDRQLGGRSLPSAKNLPQRFHACPVDPEIIMAISRRRAYVDHPGSRAELAFKIVHKAKAGAADRVQVILRCRKQGGARHCGQRVFQAAKGCRGVSRHGKRFDAVRFGRVGAAADAVGTAPAWGKAIRHLFHQMARASGGGAPERRLRDGAPRARQKEACFPASGSWAAACRQRP